MEVHSFHCSITAFAFVAFLLFEQMFAKSVIFNIFH